MTTSMAYTYSTLYNRVSKLLGTYGSSGPSGTDLTDAQDYVKSGYLRFLTAYDWTFRRRYATLSFESGEYVYAMPQDFGGFRTTFTFDASSGYPPITERSEGELMELRSYGTHSGYPQYFAVRSGKYEPSAGQTYEVVVWPTPDAASTVYYSYYYMPPMMSNDADLPMAGAEHAETILRFCLAAAEEEADENQGVHAASAMQLFADSVRVDKLREPRNLGPMNNYGGLSSWEIARGSSRINDVSYNT